MCYYQHESVRVHSETVVSNFNKTKTGKIKIYSISSGVRGNSSTDYVGTDDDIILRTNFTGFVHPENPNSPGVVI